MFGYHFIPLVRPPTLYYYTLKDKEILFKLINQCVYMWPLMLGCSFLVALAGFISWLMEMRHNPVDFSPSFISGWMSGCWWSFVTMTTVGYGDKVPKTWLGRLFSVGWTLVGITTFSLVTAMLASQLTMLNTVGQPDIAGQRIGVLKHRIYDTTAVAAHGGIAIATSKVGKDGIEELIRMLDQKLIDGFVLDRYFLISFNGHMYMNTTMSAEDIAFLRSETVRSEVHPNKEQKHAYGLLVRRREDYDYLHDFVVDNEQVRDRIFTF